MNNLTKSRQSLREGSLLITPIHSKWSTSGKNLLPIFERVYALFEPALPLLEAKTGLKILMQFPLFEAKSPVFDPQIKGTYFNEDHLDLNQNQSNMRSFFCLIYF